MKTDFSKKMLRESSATKKNVSQNKRLSWLKFYNVSVVYTGSFYKDDTLVKD